MIFVCLNFHQSLKFTQEKFASKEKDDDFFLLHIPKQAKL